MDNKQHQILLRGNGRVEVRCTCGTFLIDREGDDAEISLPQVTAAVFLHYQQVAHPELSNGHKPRLIEGKA
jgi:hypothetical protein